VVPHQFRSAEMALALFEFGCMVSNVTFEWDDQKDRLNLAKHGVDFTQAMAVFSDPARITITDERHLTEHRENTTGLVQGYLVTVTHTDRAGITRLISARPASRHERKSYHAHR